MQSVYVAAVELDSISGLVLKKRKLIAVIAAATVKELKTCYHIPHRVKTDFNV